MSYPRLDDVIKADDVSVKGTGKFAASYVNWSRVARYLREHAPGWQPYAKPNDRGGLEHQAPDGSYYLLIGFRHPDPEQVDTELVPHAVMDHTMKAKKNADARDIADAYVRGMCKAAALLFGLGWNLWSKDDPFERDEPAEKPRQVTAKAQKLEPFDHPDEAKAAIQQATSQKTIDHYVARVMASGFDKSDLADIKEMTRERRAILTEEEAA